MLRHITFTVFITTSMNTLATGMVPETSVLLVDEKRGEASINIKNTDNNPHCFTPPLLICLKAINQFV